MATGGKEGEILWRWFWMCVTDFWRDLGRQTRGHSY